MSTHLVDFGPQWEDQIDMVGLVSIRTPGGRKLTSFIEKLGGPFGDFELPEDLYIDVCTPAPDVFEHYHLPAGSWLVSSSKGGCMIVTPAYILQLDVDADNVLSITATPGYIGW